MQTKALPRRYWEQILFTGCASPLPENAHPVLAGRREKLSIINRLIHHKFLGGSNLFRIVKKSLMMTKKKMMMILRQQRLLLPRSRNIDIPVKLGMTKGKEALRLKTQIGIIMR